MVAAVMRRRYLENADRFRSRLCPGRGMDTDLASGDQIGIGLPPLDQARLAIFHQHRCRPRSEVVIVGHRRGVGARHGHRQQIARL